MPEEEGQDVFTNKNLEKIPDYENDKSLSDKSKKRNNLACTHCRQRHSKCDGQGKPCSKCLALRIDCVYLEADKKVVISVKYLDKLQDQISKLKVENANLRSLSKSINDNNDRSKGTSTNQNTETVEKNVKNSTVRTECNEDAKEDTTVSNNNEGSNKRPYSQMNSSLLSSSTSNNQNTEKKSQEIIPPFLEKYGRLIHSRTGERLYIGSSSMTLFGLEINRIVAPMLNNTHNKNADASPDSVTSNSTENETILEKEGNAYRIMLGNTHSRPGKNVNFTLPSYSYAMLLVDSFVSYNDGCFYFFNEGLVKENLRRIYNNESNENFKFDYGIEALNNSTQNEATLETIWFCKLLLIFAIGEMYLGTANFLNGYKLNERTRRKKQKLNRHKYRADSDSGKLYDNNNSNGSNASTNDDSSSPAHSTSKRNKNGTKLPGSGFFSQASDLFTGLFASGSLDNCTREGGIEVLLLYAFYLQVADCTAASYFYFGIALRASLLLGLHVDIGKDTLNRFELEHRRRLWWTVYMYERMLASKAGLPLSLTDEDISTELPTDFNMSNPNPGCENYIFPEADFISNCVKITKINANILRKLYTRQPSSNILPVVHELVVSLLQWKKTLPNDINCDYSQPELDISRLVVSMMTEYFQGINLAVRPLLFHFVLYNLKSTNPKNGKYLDLSKYSSVILALLNASFQSSINTIRSLWALVPENMVAMFGYMDREYLFNATATLVLFNATFGVYNATRAHLDHALILFTKMRNLGNHPATLRREQILKLLSILDFNGAMADLIEKHNDNLRAPSSSANLDKSFGHKVNFVNMPSASSDDQNINGQEVNNHTNNGNKLNNAMNNKQTQPPKKNVVNFSSILSGQLKSDIPIQNSMHSNNPQQSVFPAFPPNNNGKNSHNANHNPIFNHYHQNAQSSQQHHHPQQPTQPSQPYNQNSYPQKQQYMPQHNNFVSTIDSVFNNVHNDRNADQLATTPLTNSILNPQVPTMNGNNEMPTPSLLPFSPSLSLMFNHIDNIPEFEQLSSTSNDLELWKDVTDQAAWLQNDVGGEFNHLFD